METKVINLLTSIDLYKPTEEQTTNTSNGGDCLIFDLLDELSNAFKDDKDLCERILLNIQPDLFRRIDTTDSSIVKAT